jgi:Fe-S cluster assembly protein SufD
VSDALAEIGPYVEAFKRRGAKGEPGWLSARREGAIKRFAELGFPSRRQEAWRFTNLQSLQKASFPPADDAAAIETAALAPWRYGGEAHRLVLINGRFSPHHSAIGALPKGVYLASTAQTLKDRPDLLESALRETDTIAHFGTGGQRSFHLRNLVLLGSGSRATLIESYAGAGAYWTNAAGVIGLGQGAAFTHVKLQDESAAAIHLAQNRIELGRDARYESFALTLGAKLSRHDSQARFEGEGAECHLNGAFLLRGTQEATNVTFADHAAPRGTTRELFKGVAEGSAHGAFLGTIAVRPNAQKTDAHMLNKNLLLSPRAAIDTKPELDILADDVKCGHGATVGDLDDEALFYLESRGLPAPEARQMLIAAFAADALDRVENKDLRAFLDVHAQRWLAGRES